MDYNQFFDVWEFILDNEKPLSLFFFHVFRCEHLNICHSFTLSHFKSTKEWYKNVPSSVIF